MLKKKQSDFNIYKPELLKYEDKLISQKENIFQNNLQIKSDYLT
jgi:hypothetical protein